MAKHKSIFPKHLDSLAKAIKHIKEYDPEMRQTIKKAVELRRIIQKHYPAQMIQLL